MTSSSTLFRRKSLPDGLEARWVPMAVSQIHLGRVSCFSVAILVGIPPFEGTDIYFNCLVHAEINPGFRIEMPPFTYTFDPSSESPAWNRASVAAKV